MTTIGLRSRGGIADASEPGRQRQDGRGVQGFWIKSRDYRMWTEKPVAPVQPVSTVTREKVGLETVSCSVFTQRSLAAPR